GAARPQPEDHSIRPLTGWRLEKQTVIGLTNHGPIARLDLVLQPRPRQYRRQRGGRQIDRDMLGARARHRLPPTPRPRSPRHPPPPNHSATNTRLDPRRFTPRAKHAGGRALRKRLKNSLDGYMFAAHNKVLGSLERPLFQHGVLNVTAGVEDVIDLDGVGQY